MPVCRHLSDPVVDPIDESDLIASAIVSYDSAIIVLLYEPFYDVDVIPVDVAARSPSYLVMSLLACMTADVIVSS